MISVLLDGDCTCFRIKHGSLVASRTAMTQLQSITIGYVVIRVRFVVARGDIIRWHSTMYV